MCITPNLLADGTTVACRNCWQCNNNKINVWAGKCIAEAQTSIASYYITLTYGRDKLGVSDHMNATILTYSDVQKFLKLVRKHVGKFRYFVAGEYGSQRSRAHWHIILFAKEALFPNIELSKEKYSFEYWKHGYSYIEPFDFNNAFYVAKYCLKNEKQDAKFGASKYPPLGTDWFKSFAELHVEKGLSPTTPFYKFPNVTKFDHVNKRQTSKQIQFVMKRTVHEQFMDHFISSWEKAYPDRPIPPSDMIEEYLDLKQRKNHEKEMTPEEALYRKEMTNRNWPDYGVTMQDYLEYSGKETSFYGKILQIKESKNERKKRSQFSQ